MALTPQALTQKPPTPGPWQADRNGGGDWVITHPVEGKRGMYEVVGSATNTPDARLIAAAPDLLEAAGALLDALSVEVVTGNILVREYNAVRAAINKAKGYV